ncbi:MAG: glycosyltransferase [Clostridiales bacterium]|nr:glycosyltransferase [Clostridiales bacterium]
MKITVVTPSYNQGVFIKRTIESVLSQGIDDLEYIIMDGGSTDETVDILKEYGDKIIWKSEKDKGQTDAVNKGIRAAHGEIIGWLNSDDIYYPNAIKKVMEVFENHPEINVVYGNANHINEDDIFIEEYYTEDFDYERLKDICFICQPSLFFRKKLVDKYGFLDDKLQYCMDYDYWLRLGKGERFYRLNELIAGSRLYDDNKTLGARRKVHEEMLTMQEKNFGKASERWVYNLAHVIVDEMGIPRIKNERSNPEFVKTLAKVSTKEFLKHYKYIPWNVMKNIVGWYFQK